jgi:hypothetical protein
MNKFPRVGWILPALLLLIVVSVFTLSGCKGGSGDEPPINEDSVKTHVISLSTAIKYTANFRSSVDSFNKNCPGFQESFQMGYSEAFNSDSYRLLLHQKDSLGRLAAGIRIYYGLSKDDGRVRFIMVPYDVDGNDMLKHLITMDEKPSGGGEKQAKGLPADGGAQALEDGQRCPTVCPPHTPLNP